MKLKIPEINNISIFVFIVLFLGSICIGQANAWEGEYARQATVLEVSVSEIDGCTNVDILLSEDTSCKSFILSNPLRLVLDIENAALQSRPDPLTVDDGIIDKVRVAQFEPSVVRVVFDLSRNTSYTIIQAEDKPELIRIRFPKRITSVEFSDEGGRGKAIISGTGNLQFETSSLSAPSRIIVDLPETVLVPDGIDVPISHSEVTGIRASQFTPDTVRIVLDLVKATTYSVTTSSDKPGEVVVDLGNRILGANYECSEMSTTVGVISTGRVETESLTLTDPYRIVMDFQDSTLDSDERIIHVGDDIVERIRLAQHTPMTVRVVLDLNHYVGHSAFTHSKEGLKIEVFKSPVLKKRIVIDPGHGGLDPGAIGSSGLQEKTVALDISKKVAAYLEAMGAKVIMTRSDDVSISLPERARIASGTCADAFISVHINASRNQDSTGTETLYANTIPMSKVLAECVQFTLVNQIGQFNRGTRERDDLIVIRESHCPACLVEVAFVSNPVEELLLLEPAFRQKAAQGIANGVASYFLWCENQDLGLSPERAAELFDPSGWGIPTIAGGDRPEEDGITEVKAKRTERSINVRILPNGREVCSQEAAPSSEESPEPKN